MFIDLITHLLEKRLGPRLTFEFSPETGEQHSHDQSVRVLRHDSCANRKNTPINIFGTFKRPYQNLIQLKRRLFHFFIRHLATGISGNPLNYARNFIIGDSNRFLIKQPMSQNQRLREHPITADNVLKILALIPVAEFNKFIPGKRKASGHIISYLLVFQQPQHIAAKTIQVVLVIVLLVLPPSFPLLVAQHSLSSRHESDYNKHGSRHKGPVVAWKDTYSRSLSPRRFH